MCQCTQKPDEGIGSSGLELGACELSAVDAGDELDSSPRGDTLVLQDQAHFTAQPSVQPCPLIFLSKKIT